MRAIIRKDEQAVSPVIATILMVAITVVLAAVLYVMVSGLITGPGGTPRAMGVNISPSQDSTNWTLLVTNTPAGLNPSTVTLTILTPGGGIALAATAFSSLSYTTNGAVYQDSNPSATEIRAGDSVLVSATVYAQGTVRIADAAGILFQGTLQ